MERLTKRLESGTVVMDCDACKAKNAICNMKSCRNRLKDRLAAYEDTGLEPDEIKELCTDDVAEVAKMFRKMIESGEIKHLQDLLRAEKDGRLVVLPCKVGDTVYAAETSPVIPLSVAYVGVYLDGADGGDWEALENIGKTVFLTREEAELAGKGGAK